MDHLTSNMAMIKKLSTLFIACLISLAFVSCNKEEPNIEPQIAKNTILVYMVATNTLSGFDYMDMQEMMIAAGNIDLSRNNIVIYHCSKQSNPKLLKITKNKEVVQETVLKEYDDTYESLDPMRMREVVSDVRRLTPANNYGLVMWSHAMSWTPAKISANNTATPSYFGDDYGKHMDIDVLANALPDDLFSYIWMDCCYMSSIECAYQLRNKCDWYVGYPTEILSNGMPYNLTIPYLTGETIDLVGAANATFEYFKYSSDKNSQFCTIAVLDMSKIEALAAATKNIYQGFKPIDTYGLQKYSRGAQGPYYDLGHYARTVAEANGTTDYIDEFNKALNDFVVYKNATDKFLNFKIEKENFSGVSTHALMQDASPNEKYYFSLDWFNAVYDVILDY